MKQETIKIQVLNDTKLCVLPVLPDMKTIVPVESISGLTVSWGLKGHETEKQTLTPPTENGYIVLPISATMPLGVYSVHMQGTINGQQWSDNRYEMFELVKYGEGIRYDRYYTKTVILGLSDDTLRQLREELEQKIAEAEAAREEWLHKASGLEGVAKEENATQNKLEVENWVESAKNTITKAITNLSNLIISNHTALVSLISSIGDGVAKEENATQNKLEVENWVTSAKNTITKAITNLSNLINNNHTALVSLISSLRGSHSTMDLSKIYDAVKAIPGGGGGGMTPEQYDALGKKDMQFAMLSKMHPVCYGDLEIKSRLEAYINNASESFMYDFAGVVNWDLYIIKWICPYLEDDASAGLHSVVYTSVGERDVYDNSEMSGTPVGIVNKYIDDRIATKADTDSMSAKLDIIIANTSLTAAHADEDWQNIGPA